jgi:drug/metabolite transporter (DMT)-like permease
MNPPRSSAHPSQFGASFLMTISALLFGVMAALAKAAAHRVPTQQIAFIRFVVGVLICGAAALRVDMRVSNWRGLFWRGAFGGAAVACYFASIGHLSIGLATLLNYTSPVFTALFAWLFLNEHIGLPTLGALAITTAGEWLLILGVGITSVVAQMLMTYSLRDLRAAAAGILFQLTPVSVLLLGRVFFDERPPALALAGAAVTLAGVGWGAWLGSVRGRRA